MLPAPVRVNVTEVTLTFLLREFVTEQAATLNCRVSVLDRTEHRVRGVLHHPRFNSGSTWFWSTRFWLRGLAGPGILTDSW